MTLVPQCYINEKLNAIKKGLHLTNLIKCNPYIGKRYLLYLYNHVVLLHQMVHTSFGYVEKIVLRFDACVDHTRFRTLHLQQCNLVFGHIR